MLSNSLINAINCNMSQANTPIQPKRFSRNSLILSHDSACKLASTSSCMSNITKEDSQNLKAESSRDNKFMPNYCKSSTEINKTTSNFSARKLWSNASKTFKSSYMHVPENNVIEEESEVIDMLTKQVSLAESQMRKVQSILTKAEKGLQAKDQEIGRLKRKVKDWESKYRNQEILRKKEQRSQANSSEYFYDRCLALEQKIFEMEKFLADYGLVWIGDTKSATSATSDSNNYIDTYYDQLVANIDQLNLAAGKDEVHVHRNEKGGGATFKTPSCMVLKFYKNGMIVQEGPLRSYDDPAASSFIRDILDGYFPSELQREYPDGVPFATEDHRTELYVADSTGFPGQGYRLGKQSPVDNLLSMSSRRSNNALSVRYGRANPLSRDSAWNADNIPLLSLPTSRSRSKTSSEALSVDLLSLRSQILASHNNACSNSHLQSHINAELARSSRQEKRESAMKNVEYEMAKEQLPKSREVLSSRTRYHSSSDRSSSKLASNQGTIGHRLRPRSRSASLPGGRLVRMQSVLRSKTSSTAEINNVDASKIVNLVAECPVTKRGPRGSKSATCARKSSPPILHQINEATGKSGELRLKVRSSTGSTVYLVHMFADEPVAKLYELLNKATKTSGHRTYKVVLSGYSPKRLEYVEGSLRENGINRDCVLHLVND